MEWYKLLNESQIDSPALLVYPERIEKNIERMINIACDPERLRPHVKTHKMAEIVKAQMQRGIRKFKCATIAEAEMLAQCDAPDVFLAYQPVGPKIQRLQTLIQTYPNTQFSTLVDNPEVVQWISDLFSVTNLTLPLYTDLDVGMHRTGIAPDNTALTLIRAIEKAPCLQFAGLHLYDGHLGSVDPASRSALIDTAWADIIVLVNLIRSEGFQVPNIIAGGTPSFPYHAERPKVELSPGTVLLWDQGYERICPDLPFEPAAALLSRVVSKPADDSVCLDLGTKAVASEMPPPRAIFPKIPEAKVVMHNEEHLVLQSEHARELAVGQCLYAIPWHICPTVALYNEVGVVENGRVKGSWTVLGRNRKLSV
jgi:D-serine deaminase-like pyridoxal phosphate-dependent protein